MKRKFLYIGALALGLFGMNSCMDYDDPGDERGANEVELDHERHEGNAGHLDNTVEITQDGFNAAKTALSTPIRQAIGGIWGLRGGKDGTLPQPHSYQYQYTMGVDAYAQYGVVTHRDFPYAGDMLTSAYNVSPAFNGSACGGYSVMKHAVAPILNHPAADSIPEIKAINLLFFDLGAQEMADLQGPFTYFEDLKGSEHPAQYNPVKDIYDNIIVDVDSIITCLKHHENRPDWYKQGVEELIMEHYKFFMPQADIIYPGVKAFIKMANALKLRIAMNLVKVDPATAQRLAEESCADPEYIITTMNDQPGLYSWNGLTNPLGMISDTWNDQRLTASFESLLVSLQHPYVTSDDPLFKKNGGKIVNRKTKDVLEANTRVVGIRTGIIAGLSQDASQNPRLHYSAVNSRTVSMGPLYYIKLAEVDFMRAEAALRGWNVGISAQEAYENGIMNSSFRDPFELDPEWGGDIFLDELKEYMEVSKAKEYTSIDPYGDGEPWPSLTKIGVKWNEADDNETKLEKIMTQKYIAVYPNSFQAWTDLRRTGYPKLFPVLNTMDGDGSIPQGQMIRRIPWQPEDPIMIELIESSAIPALGGDDLQNTRLWWDVDAPNF